MKPLHIALLVAAGAVGGAVIMKISQHPQAPLTAQVDVTPQTPPATAPPPVAVTPPVEPPAASATGEPAQPPAHPSPFEASKKEVREAPKPVRVHRAAPAAAQPPVVAQNRPAEPAPALVVVAPQAADTAPAPQPIPPARTEPENVTPPPPPVEVAPPEPHRVTLNAGTLIPVRLVDGLSSERNLPGDTFTATLDKELVVDGFVIAERGARVEGRVVASDRGGRVRGVSSLQVEIVRLRLSDGQTIGLQTRGVRAAGGPHA